MKLKGALTALVIIGIVFVLSSAYVVDETEQVVVTQFGKVVGKPKDIPGLYFRVPFIQNTNYFPKNLQQWDGDPGQIPTLDKTYLWVDPFARWRIVDPVKFFQTVNNTVSALGRLDDIIDPAVRNFVTSYSLIEAVRSTNRIMDIDTFEYGPDQATQETQATQAMQQQERSSGYYSVQTGRVAITKGIMEQAQPKLAQFGIELVDVKIKRINYVEQVRDSVYGRMIAERKQIAEKFRSEGKGEAQKILGEKERDLKEITSEAYRRAQEIRGKADAEVTVIYADAYGVDPEFYSFTKTLEVYNEALDQNNALILSTDSEFLKYLKGFGGMKGFESQEGLTAAERP